MVPAADKCSLKIEMCGPAMLKAHKGGGGRFSWCICLRRAYLYKLRVLKVVIGHSSMFQAIPSPSMHIDNVGC